MHDILQLFYGKDTRSVRVLNLFIHLIWIVLILSHLSGLVIVDLPKNDDYNYIHILVSSAFIVILSYISFMPEYSSLKLKYLSLTLGALTQSFLGLKYASIYPPFNIMVIVSTTLAIWFLFGAIYIKCLNDKE